MNASPCRMPWRRWRRPADCVLGDARDQLCFAHLNAALELLLQGAPLIGIVSDDRSRLQAALVQTGKYRSTDLERLPSDAALLDSIGSLGTLLGW